MPQITPDVVLCSTAVRAKQTLEPIAKAIKPPRDTFESRIYGVAQPELLKYLRGLPETVECAVMRTMGKSFAAIRPDVFRPRRQAYVHSRKAGRHIRSRRA